FHTIKYPKGCSNRSKLLEIEGSLSFLDYTDNIIQVNNDDPVSYKGKLKLWILEDEKKTNGHQHEWIQLYNIVDMFRYTDVPTGFIYTCFSPIIVAVVLHPTPKIIFAVSINEYEEYGEINVYYSYDVNLERLDFITEPYATHS
ncbi:hypothetical protein MKW92_004922, partial [Papaver armeniacum]